MALKQVQTKDVNELVELFDDEVSFDEETGLYQYAEYCDEDKSHCICIKFNKIFNRDDIKQHNIFTIQFRRYYGIVKNIVNDLNILLNTDSDIARRMLSFNCKIAMAIDSVMEYTEEDFIDDSLDFLDYIKDYAVEYVEDTYELNLDTDNVNKRINTDLQVNDDMNKIYIKAAMLSRVMIPIICNYCTHAAQVGYNFNKLFFKIFREIYKILARDENERTGQDLSESRALNKLTKIIKPRIYQTKYSDKVIWKVLETQTTDMQLIVQEMYELVIECIIPKLEYNKSSVTFIDTILRTQLQWKFTTNFPKTNKPLSNLDNNDDSDERDRMNEIAFLKNKDESSLMLNQLTIQQLVETDELDKNDKGFQEFNKKVFIDKNKNVNNIQNFFLILGYSRKFEFNISTEMDKRCMIYELVTELLDRGFTELPKVLSSSLTDEISYIHTRNSSKIKNQKDYYTIFKTYQDVLEVISKDNFVTKALNFKNYQFIDQDGNEYIPDSTTFESETLLFIKSCIRN